VTLYVDLTGNTAPFTTLATIIQVDPIYVYFTMSEPQILALRRRHPKATARDLLSIRRNPNRTKVYNQGKNEQAVTS
jgi:tripartite-type tricarboxylate transporter receptor subunit TctC